MAKYLRFKPSHGGYVSGPSLPEYTRWDSLLPEFRRWFAAIDGFGPYLRSFFMTYGGYFNCFEEEHALVYTQLHKEFSLNLERSIGGWLEKRGLGEEEFGNMLRRACLRGDGDGDAIVGALLGLLDYGPWIHSIFELQRASLAAAEVAPPPPPPPPVAAESVVDGDHAAESPAAAMVVIVPEGVGPGEHVVVTSPEGFELVVVVPDGCSPGTAFTVTYGGEHPPPPECPPESPPEQPPETPPEISPEHPPEIPPESPPEHPPEVAPESPPAPPLDHPEN